jgi:large subunit ribosomal protein L3
MPSIKSPRKGTMQFWPRKRSKRSTARVRKWADDISEAKPLGFTAYKVGMTHTLITDKNSNSPTKNADIICPVTVLECPPMKIAGINVYKEGYQSTPLMDQLISDKLDKYAKRALPLPRNSKRTVDQLKTEGAVDVRLVAITQPHLIGFKKKPDVIELGIGGGSVEEKLAYAKENLGKEFTISDVFTEGNQLDIHAITTGRGTQGPTKRFGTSLRVHKSEKTKRGPGSLGAWTGNRSWTVAHAGQTGYHQRTEWNKWLLKIGTNPEEISVKGGFKRYGVVKNNYILLKGSIAGPSKRAITLTHPIRPNKYIAKEAPPITYVSLENKQ